MKKPTIIIIIILLAIGAYLTILKQEAPVEEETLKGFLVMGHEARTFTSCDDAEELWVLGDSTAYSQMLSEYQSWVSGQEDPYSRLFVVLEGIITDAPIDGFGADYNYGLRATQLISIDPSGACI